MINKITEEQYQKIINLFNDINGHYNMGLLNHNVVERFQNAVVDELGVDTELIDNWGIFIAIANPLTREWAHDNFIEKEKKYIWNSKKKDNAGYTKRLFKSKEGMISDYSVIGTKNFEITESDEELTESEIKSWGYNTDMFDKEEV